MHAPSPMAILLIAIVVLVLFGRGKVSSLMGEFGKGITAFKKGLNDGTSETKAERDAALDTPVQTPATPITPTPMAPTPMTPVQPVPGTEARDVTPPSDPRV